MWREPFDGWKQQGRMLREAQARQPFYKPRPTVPVMNTDANVLYFKEGQWWASHAPQPLQPAAPQRPNRGGFAKANGGFAPRRPR